MRAVSHSQGAAAGIRQQCARFKELQDNLAEGLRFYMSLQVIGCCLVHAGVVLPWALPAWQVPEGHCNAGRQQGLHVAPGVVQAASATPLPTSPRALARHRKPSRSCASMSGITSSHVVCNGAGASEHACTVLWIAQLCSFSRGRVVLTWPWNLQHILGMWCTAPMGLLFQFLTPSPSPIMQR